MSNEKISDPSDETAPQDGTAEPQASSGKLFDEDADTASDTDAADAESDGDGEQPAKRKKTGLIVVGCLAVALIAGGTIAIPNIIHANTVKGYEAASQQVQELAAEEHAHLLDAEGMLMLDSLQAPEILKLSAKLSDLSKSTPVFDSAQASKLQKISDQLTLLAKEASTVSVPEEVSELHETWIEVQELDRTAIDLDAAPVAVIDSSDVTRADVSAAEELAAEMQDAQDSREPVVSVYAEPLNAALTLLLDVSDDEAAAKVENMGTAEAITALAESISKAAAPAEVPAEEPEEPAAAEPATYETWVPTPAPAPQVDAGPSFTYEERPAPRVPGDFVQGEHGKWNPGFTPGESAGTAGPVEPDTGEDEGE